MLRPHLCFRQSRSCGYSISLEHFTSASYSLLFLVRCISLFSLLLHPLPLPHLPPSLTFFLPFPFFFSHPLTLLLVLIFLSDQNLKTKLETSCTFVPLRYLRCCRDSVTALFYPWQQWNVLNFTSSYRSIISRGSTNATQILMITCSNANGSLTIRLHTPLRIVRRLIHFTRKCKQLDSTRSRASFKVNRKTLFLAPPCGSLTAIVFLIIHIHIYV